VTDRQTRPRESGLEPDQESTIAAQVAFGARFMADLSRSMTTLSCALGDHLGLFQALADSEPRTADELAQQLGLDARYVLEWGRTMAASGYLELRGSGAEFVLPPAQAAVLGDRDSPFYVGGIARLVPPLAAMVEPVEECFRSSRGLAFADYPMTMFEANWQMSAKWLKMMLVASWLPQLPGVVEVLTAGAAVAHLACGGGTALALLAERFPASRFEGFDRHAPNVEQARREAAAHGVADRVAVHATTSFADGLAGPYELVMTFDSLHLAEDPVAALRAVRDVLAPSGSLLLLESNCSENPYENVGDTAAFLYGTSLLYSVPLTRNGAATPGMLGLSGPALARMCIEAGLGEPTVVTLPTPFNVLYRIGHRS
jgi:SAM-dependent methyltransferase